MNRQLTLGDLDEIELRSAEIHLMLHAGIRLLLVRKREDRALIIRARALRNVRRRAVALEVRDGHGWRIDRQLLVVHTEAMAVRVRVREQATL